MDAETEELIRLTRVTLKGYIRQTKSTLAFLTKLDEKLAAHGQKEAQRDGTKEELKAAA